LLGDLGAEVIKVEPPTGDAMRAFPSTLAGESRGFVGVKSRQAQRGDQPEAAGRSGAAASAGRARRRCWSRISVRSVPARSVSTTRAEAPNPKLIYCGLTGYGDAGPLNDQPGFDQVLQSMTGIARFQGAVQGRAAIPRSCSARSSTTTPRR